MGGEKHVRPALYGDGAVHISCGRKGDDSPYLAEGEGSRACRCRSRGVAGDYPGTQKLNAVPTRIMLKCQVVEPPAEIRWNNGDQGWRRSRHKQGTKAWRERSSNAHGRGCMQRFPSDKSISAVTAGFSFSPSAPHSRPHAPV